MSCIQRASSQRDRETRIAEQKNQNIIKLYNLRSWLIGHFRPAQEQKTRGEAERTSLQLPLYKQTKMQICPPNLHPALPLLYTIQKWPIMSADH